MVRFLLFYSSLCIFLIYKSSAQVNASDLDNADRLEQLSKYHLDLNDFNYAEKLLSEALSIRQTNLSKKHHLSIETQIGLAQLCIKTFKLPYATELIEEVLHVLENEASFYSTELHAKSAYANAQILSSRKLFIEAASAFEAYHALVDQNPKLKNSDFYIPSLIQTSIFCNNFLVYNLDREWFIKALFYADQAYEYSTKLNGKNQLNLVKSLLLLSNLYYSSAYFQKGQEFALEGQRVINGLIKKELNLDRTIKLEKYLALLIFQENRCKFYIKVRDNTLNTSFLKNVLSSLEQTVEILEKNKNAIRDHKDVILIVEDYFKDISELLSFVCVTLYGKTEDEHYLDEIIKYKEAGIYSTIRNRLITKNIDFTNIPENIVKRENQLRDTLENALSRNYKLSDISEGELKFKNFLDSLKQEYPKYYYIKYGPYIRPLKNLSKKIPEEKTVIRYYQWRNKYYALVIDKDKKVLKELPYINISLYNQRMLEYKEADKLGEVLFEMYQKLWKPFEHLIQTKDVIIIPESKLFNTSFEALTFSNINSLNELEHKSLLAKYNFTYNYSLFLVDNENTQQFFDNSFVSFAPEFNESMKQQYSAAITDSLLLDKTYLTLLPQPLSARSAKTFANTFNGSAFLNHNATKRIFTKEAKEHKIIHIGTHAEADNVSPELSRLVFAKKDSENDNYLHTYEIYNQNLSANLTVLTACETGKPTYQPGEGMISLAHAFNYAGSESILTSLWKIDEQSSTEVIKHFYYYIKDGLPKDKALRKAKLKYLSTAQGRTLTPDYWAGLVLIGDGTSIELGVSNKLFYWIIGILFIIVVAFYNKLRKKS